MNDVEWDSSEGFSGTELILISCLAHTFWSGKYKSLPEIMAAMGNKGIGKKSIVYSLYRLVVAGALFSEEINGKRVYMYEDDKRYMSTKVEIGDFQSALRDLGIIDYNNSIL